MSNYIHMPANDTKLIDLYAEQDSIVQNQNIFNNINQKGQNFSLSQQQNQTLGLLENLLLSISQNIPQQINNKCNNSALMRLINQISAQQRLSFTQIQAIALEFLIGIDNLLSSGNTKNKFHVDQQNAQNKQNHTQMSQKHYDQSFILKQNTQQSQISDKSPLEESDSYSEEDSNTNNPQQDSKSDCNSLNDSHNKIQLQEVIDYGYQIVNTKYKFNLFDELISMLYNECLLETDLTMRYQILTYIRHIMRLKDEKPEQQQMFLEQINCSTIQDIFTFAGNIEFDLNVQNKEKLMATLKYNSCVSIGYLGLNIPINTLSDDVSQLLFKNIDDRIVIYNFQRPFIAIQNISNQKAFITSLIADSRINEILYQQQNNQNSQQSNNNDLFNIIVLFDNSSKIKFYTQLKLKSLTVRGDQNIHIQHQTVLRSLNLQYSYMPKMHKCKNLVNLCVQYGKFDMQVLLKLLQLKIIYFQHCDFENLSESKKFFEYFSNCKGLQIIIIKQCQHLDQLILNIHLQNLKLLSITYKYEKPENTLLVDIQKTQFEKLDVLHVTYGRIQVVNGTFPSTTLVESINLNYEHQLKLFKLRL